MLFPVFLCWTATAAIPAKEEKPHLGDEARLD
jgi:hypothetical protein